MNPLAFSYRLVQGAIAKRFVVKHYPYGVVMTKYPNMKDIVPSGKQKMRRRLFRKAVRYAQKVCACPARKEEKRRLLRKPKRLFQALMKEWFKRRKEKEFYRTRRRERWKRNVERQVHEWDGVRQKGIGEALNYPAAIRWRWPTSYAFP